MIRQRRAELEALVDDVAPAGWRDDRRWRVLLTAAAICEGWAGGRASGYLASNGEPHADTFMGFAGPGPTELAGWIGWAIAAAHAVVGAIAARDGQLPGQPLRVRLARRRGLCDVVPATAATTVGFAIGHRVVVATLDPRGPAAEQPLARRLAAHARGERPEAAPAPAGPPIAVIAIGDEALEVAHHGHRRAWTADGGPWLGVARAEGLTVLSTCHLAVDGFGHAHLTADVAAALDRGAARALAAAAATGDAPPPPLVAIAPEQAVPLGVAWRRLPSPAPRVAHQAWALGRALAAGPGGPRARGATLQIPVAAGAPDDPTRFARRVRTALVTVRFSDGRPEPLPGFTARVRGAIADEAAGRGLLGRMLAALAGAPLPLGLKRRWLGGARRAAPGGPADVLAGDGCVSVLRLAGAPRLVAASAPGKLLAAGDADASAVLTVIDDGGGATATVAGRGRAGSAAGAAALLDAWHDALDAGATVPAGEASSC